MAETSPWIAIVDDDPAVLRALSRLLRSRAFLVTTYGSGQEFLAALPDGLPECLIVDFQMPEMNGMELHQHLISNGIAIPTILITAHAMLRYTHPGRRYDCSQTAKAVAGCSSVLSDRQSDRHPARCWSGPAKDPRSSLGSEETVHEQV